MRAERELAAARAKRQWNVSRRIVMDETGADREEADGFLRWLLANRTEIRDLIGYVTVLGEDRALEHLYAEVYQPEVELAA